MVISMDSASCLGGKWDIKISSYACVLGESIVKQAYDFVEKCIPLLPQDEETWIQTHWGIPTGIVRIDCSIIDPIMDNAAVGMTLVKDGKLGVYELEPRPSGIWIAYMADPTFRRRFDELIAKWPYFETFISPLRAYCDDLEWLNVCKNPEESETLLMMRVEPEETDYHKYISRAMAPIMEKGNKSYGPLMGLWRKIYSEELESDDSGLWERAFCLKPNGSKAKDILIWHPGPEYKKIRGKIGIATKNKIKVTLQKYGSMYLQEFIPPMLDKESGEWYIFRIFFGYDPMEKIWKYLGGFWVRRRNFVIHGASDSTHGPIKREEE